MSALRLIVNGADCEVPADVARELAGRARTLLDGLERPLAAAAGFIEACCERGTSADVRFTDREEADLVWTVEAWELEVGPAGLPPSIRALRDALRAQAA